MTAENPFPGLRPFQQHEDYLFFGREAQTAELLTRLRKSRFLAVVGTSGSGKSSLVRAGLVPALEGGGMQAAGSGWDVAILRPGGDPLRHVAEALCAADLYDPGQEATVQQVRATLSRSRFGLVEAARQSDMEPGSRLLVIVDQFEEIFRFSRFGVQSREEATDFIRLLLEAADQQDVPIYVVITMRSDYIGDCSRFAGLAEAVNRGEYLIPRLERQHCQRAIEGPVRVAGGQISERLVQRLLYDPATIRIACQSCSTRSCAPGIDGWRIMARRSHSTCAITRRSEASRRRSRATPTRSMKT